MRDTIARTRRDRPWQDFIDETSYADETSYSSTSSRLVATRELNLKLRETADLPPLINMRNTRNAGWRTCPGVALALTRARVVAVCSDSGVPVDFIELGGSSGDAPHVAM